MKKKKQTGEGEEMTKRSSEETTREGWRRRHVEKPKLEAGCGWLCSNRKRREENRRRKKERGTGEIGHVSILKNLQNSNSVNCRGTHVTT